MKKKDYYAVVNSDYDEGNWLEDIFLWIIDKIIWIILFFVGLWCKIFVVKEKRIVNQIKYLEGTAIKEGNLYCLSVIPLPILTEKKELIKNNLQYLFWTDPTLIIGLLNLKIGNKERIFIDEIMSEIFNFSKQNLVHATLKILGSDLSPTNKTLLVCYLTKNVRPERREYLIHFFRETFKKMGDPMKQTIEELIGKKL